eukprot:GHRR01027801.1.p2 GENE.GHRR01027801.1~~GHRR01027801.1.p2  ORF type:complete len:110 (+),score=14.91 GHRR01027801.1:264-593(+)
MDCAVKGGGQHQDVIILSLQALHEYINSCKGCIVASITVDDRLSASVQLGYMHNGQQLITCKLQVTSCDADGLHCLVDAVGANSQHGRGRVVPDSVGQLASHLARITRA